MKTSVLPKIKKYRFSGIPSRKKQADVIYPPHGIGFVTDMFCDIEKKNGYITFANTGYFDSSWDGYDIIVANLANIITDIEYKENLIPSDYSLNQNFPNPFNPSTTIEFSLPKSEFVELKVYNILGKEVSTLVSNKLNQGNHTYQFDGNNLASGVYYYQLVAGQYREVKKMILLR
jgi:hypothetical protein